MTLEAGGRGDRGQQWYNDRIDTPAELKFWLTHGMPQMQPSSLGALRTRIPPTDQLEVGTGCGL